MPRSLAEPLQPLSVAFGRLLPDLKVVVGGGSVLAARWFHRHSTDIDMFVSPEAMARLLGEQNLMYAAVAAHLKGVTRTVSLDAFSGFLAGDLDGTTFSLAASEFVRDDRPSSETVAGTHFHAATNEEVVAGKIRGRLHRRGDKPVEAPVRDLYDIAVAPYFEPGLIDRILHGIVPRGRAVIAADLRLLPEDIQETGSKPLIRPRYAFEWRTLAAAVADAVEAGDESLLPTPAPVRQRPEP